MAREHRTPDRSIHEKAALSAALSDDTRADEVEAVEAEQAPPAHPPVKAHQSDAERIAALEAKIALLTDMASRPGIPDVSAAAILNVVQPEHPIESGSTVRPNEGKLHPTLGIPLFNTLRPTGRHG